MEHGIPEITNHNNFRLHNGDTSSSSCSTLSDEDSTPHVSRSNSYGRSENDNGNGGAHDGSYDIYLRDDHLSPKKGTTPNLLFSAGGGVDTPPGYEETISRQRLLKNYNRSVSFILLDLFATYSIQCLRVFQKVKMYVSSP